MNLLGTVNCLLMSGTFFKGSQPEIPVQVPLVELVLVLFSASQLLNVVQLLSLI